MSIQISEALDFITRMRHDAQALLLNIDKEKKRISGEVDALNAMKYEVLVEGFTAALKGLSLDRAVDRIEHWGFGDRSRQALAINRSKPDEILYSKLKDAVADATDLVSIVSAKIESQQELVKKAIHVLNVRDNLEAIRVSSTIFKHPELSFENYAIPSLARRLFSPSYRKLINSLSVFEEKNGNLFEKVSQAEKIYTRFKDLEQQKIGYVDKVNKAKNSLTKYEESIVVPVSAEVFITRQVKSLVASIVDNDEFPADLALNIKSTNPAFVDTIEKFAKLQAQCRIADNHKIQLPTLNKAALAWESKLTPLYNKLERHKNNKKATIELPVDDIYDGLVATKKSVNQALSRMRQQRHDAGVVLSLKPTKDISVQRGDVTHDLNSRRLDSSSSNNTTSDSSDFWLYYWLLTDQNSAIASSIPDVPSSIDHAHKDISLGPALDSLDIPDIKVDTLTDSIDNLGNLNFDVNVDTSGCSAPSSPSSCGSSCSSSCGGGGGGGGD